MEKKVKKEYAITREKWRREEKKVGGMLGKGQ
jgi:hypothetical protein